MSKENESITITRKDIEAFRQVNENYLRPYLDPKSDVDYPEAQDIIVLFSFIKGRNTIIDHLENRLDSLQQGGD